jgi:hypothetical protein
MIDFMLIGAPRSGTTWAANWLTTDTSLCLHDPLAKYHYSEWDSLQYGDKIIGVADTGISAFHAWVNSHPARKIIIHRDPKEIAESLGMPEFLDVPCHLGQIDGMHVHFRELFESPREIYEYALHKEFDAERHAALKEMQIQPFGHGMVFDTVLMRKLVQEIRMTLQ